MYKNVAIISDKWLYTTPGAWHYVPINCWDAKGSFRKTAKTRSGGGPQPTAWGGPINGNAQVVHEANSNTDAVRHDSAVRTRFGIPPSPERDLDRRWACR